MATNYSWLTGLGKGLVGAAITGFGILAFVLLNGYPELYNTSIADLIAESVRQLIGGMTVGGAIAFVINFAKNYR